MDEDMVAAPVLFFIALAARGADGWHICVEEHYDDQVTVVVPQIIAPIINDDPRSGLDALLARGWSPASRYRFGEPLFMVSVDVDPPAADPSREWPLTALERTFVRRCRARGMLSVAAVAAWRRGERNPVDAVYAWRLDRRDLMLAEYTGPATI